MTRNLEALKEAYPDRDWRTKFNAIANLIEILADCIVPPSYIVSDALKEAIHLTPAGAAVRSKLATKSHVNAKDATVMLALTLGHDELFIDVEAMNVEALEAAIEHELEGKRISFPFVFGRELYDAYAAKFDEERDSLGADDTQRLLEGTPAGVYQYGHYTLGPYGLAKSPIARSLPASRRIPLFHCAQQVCDQLHPVLLETSQAAPINRDRRKLEELLTRTGVEPDEWWHFIADIAGFTRARYGDQRVATVLPLLGDGLAIGELRLLIAHALDHSSGKFRSAIAGLVQVGAAEETVAELTRAQLLQLSLFCDEETLVGSLDYLVRERLVTLAAGEIRRPITNARVSSGAFGLSAELSSHGVRFVADEPGFALLRLRRLLEKLYVRGADADEQELDWQLRGLNVPDIDERLEHFYQTTDPRSVLERMVLARRTNMIAACEEVGMADREWVSDEELVSTLLWKLGFAVNLDEDPHRYFWSRHDQVWNLAQSTDPAAIDTLKEVANSYFQELEGLLLDSLSFTTWALTSDHASGEHKFAYSDTVDRLSGLRTLDTIVNSPVGSDSFTQERVDLGNLVGSFKALSNYLEELSQNPGDRLRPKTELPEFDGKTELKQYMWRSTVPFLDLTEPSQLRIVDGLGEISRLLIDANTSTVRNDYSHFRRQPPDPARTQRSLELIRQAVTRIETLGFCRLLYSPGTSVHDRWGRAKFSYRGPRGYEHTFVRPTRFDWMGLPSLRNPSYIVRAASIGEPTELLRFTRRFGGDYATEWAAYPNRRRKTGSGGKTQNEPPSQIDDNVSTDSR